MYRCQNCNAVVGPREKMTRLVLEIREKTYPLFRTSKQRDKGRPPERERVGSATGYEIVRELQVCRACARDLAARQVA